MDGMEILRVSEMTVGGKLVPTVDARKVHAFLCSKKHFASWVRQRVDGYSFVEGRDFVEIKPQSGFYSARRPGRPTKEYALTIGMAKELCMVEATEKGRQARQYFIEIEKKWLAGTAAPQPAPAPVDLNNPETLRSLLLGYSERIIAAEAEKKQLEHKVEAERAVAASAQRAAKQFESDAVALSRLTNSEGRILISDAAKVFDIPRKKFFMLLAERRWIFRRSKRSGNGPWLPHDWAKDKGFMVLDEDEVEVDGRKHVAMRSYITPRGMTEIAKTMFPSYRGPLLMQGMLDLPLSPH
jgi:anti-repressor protein